MQHNEERFAFSNGSIGNFFFAGARHFFQSLDAAIFLYSRVSGIPSESVVLPVSSTNSSLTLGAELQSGVLIRGQSNISHPSSTPLDVDKKSTELLDSPIRRVLYLSAESDHEVRPVLHQEVASRLQIAQVVIYGVGSLYTSLCACLVVKGIGQAIHQRKCPKVLMLNGSPDRETSSMRASAVVRAVVSSLNSSLSQPQPPSGFISHLLVPSTGTIELDLPELEELGVIRVIPVAAVGGHYHAASLVETLQDIIRHSPL
jgi:cathepsin L